MRDTSPLDRRSLAYSIDRQERRAKKMNPNELVMLPIRAWTLLGRSWTIRLTATCPFSTEVWAIAKETATAPKKQTSSYVPGIGIKGERNHK